VGVCAYDQTYDIKAEKECGTNDNVPSNGNEYTNGYRPILTYTSVICVLSYLIPFPRFLFIQTYNYENFSVWRRNESVLEKENTACSLAIYIISFNDPDCRLL
jgi:hypothetical protein